MASILANRLDEGQKIKDFLLEVSRALHDRRYGDAQNNIAYIMTNQLVSEADRLEFVFDYFLTGYLHLANTGISSEITQLHRQAFSEYAEKIDPMLLCLLAEMQQEVATRDLKDGPLEGSLAALEELLPRCSQHAEANEYCEILIALCLRRLGERGRTPLLEASLDLHQSLMNEQTRRPIEIANNYGIALIRYFEETRIPKYLNDARDILEGIKPPKDGSSVSEYQCFPKVLNNLGNIAKQLILVTNKSHYLLQAMECYGEAEKYWSEIESPYEWAMLQKNKAESRLFHMQVFGREPTLLDKAIAEIESSLKYRTQGEASWQSNRSQEVLEHLLRLRSSS
jgi:tetratricopeptide (TPR) repeat protein